VSTGGEGGTGVSWQSRMAVASRRWVILLCSVGVSLVFGFIWLLLAKT